MFSPLAHLRFKLIGLAYGVEHHQSGPQRGPWLLHRARHGVQQSLHTAQQYLENPEQDMEKQLQKMGVPLGSVCLVFRPNQKATRTDGYIIVLLVFYARTTRLLKPNDPPRTGGVQHPRGRERRARCREAAPLLHRQLYVLGRVRIAHLTVKP